MREHFPAFDSARLEWTNVLEREGPNTQLLEGILARHISAPEVLVEVHRKLGAMVPLAEAAKYISAHIGEGQIRVADREFTSSWSWLEMVSRPGGELVMADPGHMSVTARNAIFFRARRWLHGMYLRQWFDLPTETQRATMSSGLSTGVGCRG